MWKFFSELIEKLAFTEILWLVLLVAGGFWIYKSHQRQLDDRQKEIDRLATDNRDLRDRNERLMDRFERMAGGSTATMPVNNQPNAGETK